MKGRPAPFAGDTIANLGTPSEPHFMRWWLRASAPATVRLRSANGRATVEIAQRLA